MSLMPKRVKYRKSQRGRIRGNATRGNYVAFGDYGMQAMEPGWLTAQQLEAARVVLSRALGTDGRYWCRVFPHKSITKKPAETRMGKGKGDLDHWVAVVKRGKIVFELGGVPEDFAKQILPNRFRQKFAAQDALPSARENPRASAIGWRGVSTSGRRQRPGIPLRHNTMGARAVTPDWGTPSKSRALTERSRPV